MIIDRCRDKKELEIFFIDHPMDDGVFDFDFICNNPHLYCFYDDNEGYLKGYINIYENKENKLFLSGAGVRHNLPDNINAIIRVCEAYNQDMYADTDKKRSGFLLEKSGL